MGLSADQINILEKITSEIYSDEDPSSNEERALALGGASWKGNERLSAQTAGNPALFGGYSVSGKEVLEALKESGILAELSSYRMIQEDASRKNDEDERYVCVRLRV